MFLNVFLIITVSAIFFFDKNNFILKQIEIEIIFKIELFLKLNDDMTHITALKQYKKKTKKERRIVAKTASPSCPILSFKYY